MKAIVTGGAGFIGSHVAEDLLSQGHEVLVIDDLSGGFVENVPQGASFKQCSVTDRLDELFCEYRPDAVYHLAAYAAEGLSHHIPVFNYENNLRGTVNVLAASYRCAARHFVFTSSIAVYGHARNGCPFQEDSPCVPCDPYGIAKLACEHHIQAFARYYGKPSYTIFRPHNVFGPRQNISDPYRNVIGIFLSRAMMGKALPIFGDGSQTRSFSYVTAVSRCIAAAPLVSEAKNETFNVGADQPLSVLELAKMVCDTVGAEQNIEFFPARKEVHDAHSAHEKVRRIFPGAFADETGVRIGIQLMFRHVAQRPVPPVTACPSMIEIEDELPERWRCSAGLDSTRAESLLSA